MVEIDGKYWTEINKMVEAELDDFKDCDTDNLIGLDFLWFRAIVSLKDHLQHMYKDDQLRLFETEIWAIGQMISTKESNGELSDELDELKEILYKKQPSPEDNI